jgi:serine/threonine protein kinase
MDLTPFHGPPATAPRVPGFVTRTLLGFGTHGEVWLADDLSTGGTVALKIGRRVPDDTAAASGDPPGARPEQETALLCRIDHPHIVRLQRVVPLPDGGLAMVLDLAAGGSLASLVAARGRLDPGEVSTLLIPLADALEHLHRRGIVHSDLAPGNVLFTGDGRPQLGDLGVARVLGTRIRDTWATPGFTDPALSRSGIDKADLRAADLWGLAAVGWFALTGRPPDPTALADPIRDHGPELAEVLVQCLTGAPADRPSLSELADKAWQAARPTPVRLLTARESEADDVGLPPLSNRVTRRVPIVGTDSVRDDGTGDDWLSADPSGTRLPSADADLPDRSVTLHPSAGPGSGCPAATALAVDPLISRDGGPRADGLVDGEGRDDRVPDRSVRVQERAAVARIRASGRGFGAGDRRSGQAQWFRMTARRGGLAVVAVLAVAAVIAAVGVALTVRPAVLADVGRGSPSPEPDGRSTTAGAASGGPGVPVAGSSASAGSSAGTSVRADGSGSGTAGSGPTASDVNPSTSGNLEAELTRALIAIGRSRAAAFGQASARFLAGADVAGSPAYLEDFALVQRLRSEGYRLRGVRYTVSAVRVLQRRGELVDVRAMVTTSEHRQVQVGSGAAVAVPADGPRPVVLTVAPVDLNRSGPARWRVRSVQVPS